MPTYFPLTRAQRLPVAHVDVQKISVVDTDATFGKLRNLESEFIHSLQRQTGQTHVRRQFFQMFAVWNSAKLTVVPRATISGMHPHWYAGERPQLFKPIQQARIDLQTTTTATTQFLSRKVRT